MKALLTSIVLTLLLLIPACAAHAPRCASHLTPINRMPPPSVRIGGLRPGRAVTEARP